MSDFKTIRAKSMRFTPDAREYGAKSLPKDPRLNIETTEGSVACWLDIEFAIRVTVTTQNDLHGNFVDRDIFIWFLEDMLPCIEEGSWVSLDTRFSGNREYIMARDGKLVHALAEYGVAIEDMRFTPLPIPGKEV